MPTEYFEQRERALLGPRYEQLYAAPQEAAERGVTVSALRAMPEQFAQKADFPLEASPFCKAAFVVHAPEFKPGRHPYHHAGVFYSQEPSASSAAPLLGVQPGMRVLDLCAAPGGKSFAAAMQMENTGSILSCDLHAHKISLIEKNAARLGISILKAEQRSASEFDPALEAQFDLVIADVPCSGLGVIRKKPDIRYKPLDAIERLPEVQRAILETVSRYVKPGGALLYSTCTVRKEENEAVALPFLQAHPEFSLEPFPVPDGLDLPNEGYAALLPHKHAADGFFICKLRKHA